MFNIFTLPQVTIGAVEGRARGTGNELLVALDMRFATKNDTFFGQPEVGNGLFSGGGGSQFSPGLIGRGLALDSILNANDVNADILHDATAFQKQLVEPTVQKLGGKANALIEESSQFDVKLNLGDIIPQLYD
ncbi:hypothetical protein SLS60_000177 [Paraconiothyrium brasiliense]|uniref:Uncharacterized protein n=1 Tax=Paraconiothyrium brasiliense TaxID=300254 RepID=A0ABR3S6P1_9PLEO